jgi:hypothetical protein
MATTGAAGPTEHEHPGEPTHEHPDSFVPEPIVDPHRFHVLRRAIRAALPDDAATAEAYERAVATLEARFRELDRITDVGRWMPFGDTRAAALFRDWLLALRRDRPDGLAGAVRADGHPDPGHPDPGHPDPGHPDPGQLEPGPAGGMAAFPDTLNWEPVLDLFIEAAYAAGADDDLRREHVALVGELVGGLGSLIDPLHHYATEFLALGSRPTGLLHLLDALAKGTSFPRLPGEHDECRAAIQGVLSSGGSALARTMRAVEVDANTDRIGQLVPSRLCVPGQVRILPLASTGFDATAPPRVGVYVNGTAGTIDSWNGREVLASFPEEAGSGHVWFQRVPDPPADLGSSVEEDMRALSACPTFAGGMIGRGSALAHAYLGLPGRVQPMRTPDHRRPETFLTCRHAPQIVAFTALDDQGRQVTGFNPGEACAKVTLRWTVLSDDPTPPAVDILDQAVVRFPGLAPTGTVNFTPPAYVRLTLRAQNACGSATRDLDVEVRRPVLRLGLDRVAVVKGQSAALPFSFSCPVTAPTTVSFVSSDPARASVTASFTVPAGAAAGQVTVTGVAPAAAERVAATITASAPGYTDRTVDVWVENPLGEWAVVKDPADPTTDLELPLVAIHAALLRTGKVLFFAGDETDVNALDKVKMVLWDPPAGGWTDIAATMPAPRNLFCAGHAFLSDGRLLVAAGHAHSPLQNLREEVIGAIIGGIVTGGLGGVVTGAVVGTAVGRGVDHDVHVYDPVRNAWTRHRDMDKARWYPSCVTLPDGKVLIASGYCAGAPPHPFTLFGAPVNEDYDLFDPATGDLVAIKNPTFLPGIDLYPRLIVLPGGALFVHSRTRTTLFYPDGNAPAPLRMARSGVEYLTNSPNRRTYPLQGACVLLPLLPEAPDDVRVLVVGGGFEGNTTISWTNPATHTAEIFDFDQALDKDTAQAGWRTTRRDGGGSLNQVQRRFMSDAVLLPDRTVLVVGGAAVGRDDFNSNPVLEAMSFATETEQWRAMAWSTVERRYHSTALLLPDGRVVSAGSSGGWAGPPWEATHPVSFQYKLEVFTPPYLFRGPRPVIGSLGSWSWSYGQLVSIGTDDARDIGSVALIRTGSATHTTNMDQRYVGLEITRRGTDSLGVRTPADATIAPPGVYLLFIVRGTTPAERVPSVARFVQLG